MIPLGDALKDQRGRNLGGVTQGREVRQAFGRFKLGISERLAQFQKAVDEDRYADASLELNQLTEDWNQGMSDYSAD